jgi:hypothetical protein
MVKHKSRPTQGIALVVSGIKVSGDHSRNEKSVATVPADEMNSEFHCWLQTAHSMVCIFAVFMSVSEGIEGNGQSDIVDDEDMVWAHPELEHAWRVQWDKDEECHMSGGSLYEQGGCRFGMQARNMFHHVIEPTAVLPCTQPPLQVCIWSKLARLRRFLLAISQGRSNERDARTIKHIIWNPWGRCRVLCLRFDLGCVMLGAPYDSITNLLGHLCL